MTEAKKGLTFEGSGPTEEPNLMFKVLYRPEGAAMAIAHPNDDGEASLMVEALGGLIVAFAKQLADRERVCHSGCALLSIIASALKEAKRMPGMSEEYTNAILAQAEAQGATIMDAKVPPKKDLH